MLEGKIEAGTHPGKALTQVRLDVVRARFSRDQLSRPREPEKKSPATLEQDVRKRGQSSQALASTRRGETLLIGEQPESGTRSPEQAFQENHLYLVSGAELQITELRRDLAPLQQPGTLGFLSSLKGRAFLAQAREQIMAIAQEPISVRDDALGIQAREAQAADLQRLKTQATAHYNRHIRALHYEGARNVPPDLSTDSMPASRDSHELHLVHIYHLDFPSAKQPSGYLDALKTRIKDRKPELPGATSIEAGRQRRIINDLVRTHNRWVERFGATEDVKLSEACLKGGMYYLYKDQNGYPYARFLTLRDPTGMEHPFYAGQPPSVIANLTGQWIGRYEAKGKAADGSHFEARALTTEDVRGLRAGDAIKGWACTEFRLEPVRLRSVYTDQGKKLPVVDEVPYQINPIPHRPDFQGVVVGPANPNYNCYGLAFLEGRGMLFLKSHHELQTILQGNDYYQISDHSQASTRGILIYGEGAHIAPVLGWVEKGKDPQHPQTSILYQPPDGGWGGAYRLKNYDLWVRSKLGTDVDTYHKWNDPYIIRKFGAPTLNQTDRPEGNTMTIEELT